MAESLGLQIKRSFELAALTREAKIILSARGWRDYQLLDKHFAAQRRDLERNYASEYQSRVETVRKRLIDGRAAKTKEFKHRFLGSDRFDANALLRQAHRQVRTHHAGQLQGLEKRELGAKAAFLEQQRRLGRTRGKAQASFAKVARNNPDRSPSSDRPRTRARQRR
ncbi:hypothetical protein B7H23_01255 [Notoacmeibacter marinus]|uniref:Uncharacterized protein n=1 Tax=Notoacmeibacter marinus TaxID=1876515 RepID=A0A231V0J6_9HYPH|nr:hypothetical protein [Notoacmeibacter marinus]OXT01627.1 hypothetical protein B7H23_01255 [Notoacmeibacter marinus]